MHLNLKKIKQFRSDKFSGLLFLLLILLCICLTQIFFRSNEFKKSYCESELNYVYLNGSVNNPGVYHYCGASTLSELIIQAGGLKGGFHTPDSFKDVIFSCTTELVIQLIGDKWSFSKKDLSAFYKVTLGIPISINNESEEGLTAIPGIGPGLAKKIVNERSIRGKFNNLSEITEINGIGLGTYTKIAPYVIL